MACFHRFIGQVKKFIGYILLLGGSLFALSALLSAFFGLTGQLDTGTITENIALSAVFLLAAAIFIGIARIGWKLKGTKNKPVPPQKTIPLQPQEQPQAEKPTVLPKQAQAAKPTTPVKHAMEDHKIGLISTAEHSSAYTKFYRCRKIIQPVPFLKMLKSSGISVEKVFLKRDAGIDMQSGIGDYTLEALEKAWKGLEYGPVCQFTLHTSIDGVPVEIHFSDDSAVVYLVTPEKDQSIAILEQGVPILDRETVLLAHKSTSNFRGTLLKAYTIAAPYTPVDCLLILLRHPDFSITDGKREAEHDVGFGSSMDYDSYSSVQDFLSSGHYERYAGNAYISDYSFSGSYKSNSFRIGFADQGIMTLICYDETLDLCQVIEEVKRNILQL